MTLVTGILRFISSVKITGLRVCKPLTEMWAEKCLEGVLLCSYGQIRVLWNLEKQAINSECGYYAIISSQPSAGPGGSLTHHAIATVLVVRMAAVQQELHNVTLK